jgi:hypothetical protein
MVHFMARQAAEAHLTAAWSRIPGDLDPGAVAALVADGTAEMRDEMGMREWRRKAT